MNNEMVIACAVISMVSLLMSSYLFVRYRELIEAERDHETRPEPEDQFTPPWVRCECCGSYPKITLNEGPYWDVKCENCGLESSEFEDEWKTTSDGVLAGIKIWNKLNAKIKAAKRKEKSH